MFSWIIRYYDGELPFIEILSEDMEWESVPQSGVVDVNIHNSGYSHVIRGFDNYWISGSYYGCFNNTGSLGEYEEDIRREGGYEQIVYTGKQAMMWKWETPEEHIYIGEDIPHNIYPISGVMLPDELAREIGII